MALDVCHILSKTLTCNELSLLPSHVRLKLESLVNGNEVNLKLLKEQFDQHKADSERRFTSFEREINGYKIKLQMSEDFSIKLREQLKNVEDTLQRSRREYYDVVIGKYF